MIEKEKIQNASVQLVYFEAPSIYIMTPKDPFGEGLIAKLTESDEASRQISDIDYTPALLILQHLDSLLRTKGLVNQLVVDEQAKKYITQKELKSGFRYTAANAEYVFEVYVPAGLTWSATYAGMKWKQYSVTLGAELRIYRVSDKTLLYKDYRYQRGLSDQRLKFKLQDLEENGSEKLTAMVEIASREVAIKFVEKLEKISK